MPYIRDIGAPYPLPHNDQERFVINLPSYDEETEQRHLQVQIIVGRVVEGDDGQRYVYRGSIKEQTLDGWGYSYWVAEFDELVATRSTPLARHKGGFIPLIDAPVTRYNSKLPIVVYCPAGGEVRYKVWADETGRHGQGDAQHGTRAAPAAAATVPYHAAAPQEQSEYPTEGAEAAPAGEEQPPNIDDPAYRELAPENKPPAVVPISSFEAERTERGAPAEYPVPGQQNPAAFSAQTQEARVVPEPLQAEQQQVVHNPEERANAVQPRTESTAANSSQKKAKELKAEELRSNSGIAPISSTEYSPGKSRSPRAAGGVNPRRSGSVTERDSSAFTSKNRKESTSKRDSSAARDASSKKRGSAVSPQKTRDDKYREL